LADGSDAEVAPSDPDPQELVRVDVCPIHDDPAVGVLDDGVSAFERGQRR